MKTSFEIKSGKIRVTDPCYDKNTWCSGVIENALSGEWFADSVILDNSQTNGWGSRVSELVIWHKDYDANNILELTDIDVGVDSGQAGFFDEAEYPEGDTGEYGNTETFYGKVCEGTAGEPKQVKRKLFGDDDIKLLSESGLSSASLEVMRSREVTDTIYDYLGIANVGFGVATHSGYGDGGYRCYIKRNQDGNVVAAKIVFINESEDEDEMSLEDAVDTIIESINNNTISEEHLNTLKNVFLKN